MTDADLQAIRERCEAATPGPWEAFLAGEDQNDPPDYTVVCCTFGGGWDIVDGVFIHDCASKAAWLEICRNHCFIAHARQDIPNLLAEVARLRKPAIEAALLRTTLQQLLPVLDRYVPIDELPNVLDEVRPLL